MRQRVLVADDDEAARSGLASLLSAWGYDVAEAVDGKHALEQAAAFRPSVVITDMVMPGLDGLELLKPLADIVPDVPVLLLTGHATIESAVSAMRDGACDYLLKPVNPTRLKVLLESALERESAQKGEAAPEAGPSPSPRRTSTVNGGAARLLGKSPAMEEVYRLIDLASASSAPVLISGETGTGKELVARTIHEQSSRAKGPFVAVNCSAIPETLLESELFGHEKGAFTGAAGRRAGYFELAHGGTLFLDEITEMSPALQAKYLRVLQDAVFRRLGGGGEIRVDVRVAAATNKDASKAVRDGALREDLYYRVNVLNIPMPPLRRRSEDIPLLIQAFVEEFNAKYDRHVTAVDESAMVRMREHAWPGNVRELRNLIERAVVACQGDRITPELLPLGPPPENSGEQSNVVSLPVGTTLEEGERELILRTLESVNNNKTKAAEILGTTPKTLHNKARRWKADQNRK